MAAQGPRSDPEYSPRTSLRTLSSIGVQIPAPDAREIDQADQPVGAKCPIGIKPSKIFFFEFRPIHWIIENYRPNFKSMLEIGT